MPETIEKPEIVKTPGTVGGKARIEGTRISVLHIVRSKESGMTKEEMKKAYDLTEPEIEAALEYYENNEEEIENDRKRREEIIEEVREDENTITLSDLEG